MSNNLKSLVLSLKNALLYSNVYIALCAVASVQQTLLLMDLGKKTSLVFSGLVFFATVFIYATHRLVSLTKIHKPDAVERFSIIGANQRWIFFFAAFSVLGGALCFFQLQLATCIALILPAVLSLAYVLPFIGKSRKRLRDLHFIKIGLIATVWAYVSVVLPLIEAAVQWSPMYLWMYLERVLFIFAITLPFDIRDWSIDKAQGVLTIPAIIGVSKTKLLGTFILLVWSLVTACIYPLETLPGFLVSAFVSAILLWASHQKRSDFYFTGLIDGTIWMQFVLIWLSLKLF